VESHMRKHKRTLFDAWMHHLSDAIQHAARAYGENFSAEEMWRVVQSSQGGLHDILLKLFHTATLHIILISPYFLSSTLITPSQHNRAQTKFDELVHELAGQSLHLVEGLGLPDQVFDETPAASFGSVRGWDGFNDGDNRGEVLAKARL